MLEYSEIHFGFIFHFPEFICLWEFLFFVLLFIFRELNNELLLFLFFLLLRLFELIRELSMIRFININLCAYLIIHEFRLLDRIRKIIVIRLDFFAALLNHITKRIQFSTESIDFRFVLLRCLLLVDDLLLQFRGNINQWDNFLLK